MFSRGDGRGESARFGTALQTKGEIVTTEPERTHTPGPWTWKNRRMTVEGYIDRVLQGGPEGDGVVYHSAVWTMKDADAKLIAAAPDLLDLVKRLRGWDHLDGAADGPYWRRELDAAIAKAEGR